MRRLPTHTDERGRLLVAEDAEVGFPIRRAFAVTGVPAGAIRGEHVVPCRQALVLIAGSATVWCGPSPDDESEFTLQTAGDTVDLHAGSWVRYTLGSPESVVLVLAAEEYRR